jgi:hypothetical protein
MIAVGLTLQLDSAGLGKKKRSAVTQHDVPAAEGTAAMVVADRPPRVGAKIRSEAVEEREPPTNTATTMRRSIPSPSCPPCVPESAT